MVSTRRAVTRVIAVIGCGHWGPNHVRVFNALSGARVAWAADLNPARLAPIAARYPGIHTTTEYADLLADPSVDGVVIATPASTHAAIAFDALRAGKHVLCEKPLGVSSDECERLVRAAAAAARVLMVGHVFLFNPGILAIRHLLQRAALGRVSHVHAQRANRGPVRSDVGVTWDLAAHEISICNFLFEATPLAVSAEGRPLSGSPGTDAATMTLTYPGAIAVRVGVDWAHTEKVRRMSFVGESGTATFDDLSRPAVTVDQSAISGWENLPAGADQEPLRAQARHFIDAIACGHAGHVDAVHGWNVVRTLEAIDRSMRSGGALVSLQAAANASPAA